MLGVALIAAVMVTLSRTSPSVPSAPAGAAHRALSHEQGPKWPSANTAFIVLKPHAVTDSVIRHVYRRLRQARIEVIRKGKLSTTAAQLTIAEYVGRIAERALDTSPGGQFLPAIAEAAFEAKFGESWDKAASENRIVDLASYAAGKSVDPLQLSALWENMVPERKLQIKPGFSIGKFENKYITNPWWPMMEASYLKPGGSLFYLEVMFKPHRHTYKEYLSDFIGDAEPALCKDSTLRHDISANWEALGLKSAPGKYNNAIESSTNPFESAWKVDKLLGDSSFATHPFIKFARGRGISIDALEEMIRDQFIQDEATIYDYLYSLDHQECLAKLKEVYDLID